MVLGSRTSSQIVIPISAVELIKQTAGISRMDYVTKRLLTYALKQISMDSNADKYTSRQDTKKRFDLIYNLIPQQANSILDIGCARYKSEIRSKNDLHAFLVNETNAAVKGIDINRKAIKKMQEEGYDVYVADAQDFDFGESFDVIIVGEVIEYLPNPGQFINNALDHLSNSGRIIITTENPLAFSYWRKSLQSNFQPNILWFNPDRIIDLSDRLSEDDVEITWLSPDGGISTLLWTVGYKRASAPRYCALLTPE